MTTLTADGHEVRSLAPLRQREVEWLLFGQRVYMRQWQAAGRSCVALYSRLETDLDDPSGPPAPMAFLGDSPSLHESFLIALQTLVRFRFACGKLAQA